MTVHVGRSLLEVVREDYPKLSADRLKGSGQLQCTSRGSIYNYTNRQCYGVLGHVGPHFYGDPHRRIMYWVDGATS